MINQPAGSNQICLSLLPGRLAVCRFDAGTAPPSWVRGKDLLALVSTADELSIVCDEDCVPHDAQVEAGWRAWKVCGPLEFSLIGVLAGISHVLADARVSIFVLSTYDTDYVLVKEMDLVRAGKALLENGYLILESGDS